MLVKELIAALRGQDPNAEVGLGLEASHYVSKIATVLVEDRPACVPSKMVVIMMADESYVPADEA